MHDLGPKKPRLLQTREEMQARIKCFGTIDRGPASNHDAGRPIMPFCRGDGYLVPERAPHSRLIQGVRSRNRAGVPDRMWIVPIPTPALP